MASDPIHQTTVSGADQPQDLAEPPLLPQQHAGALLAMDEQARRQVRIKQINMQKALLATALAVASAKGKA